MAIPVVAKVVLSAIAKGAKWLGPKILKGAGIGVKKAGLGIKAANKFVVDQGSKRVGSLILKTGVKAAAAAKSPFTKLAIEQVSKHLAKETVLKPIVQDLVIKGVKHAVKPIPKIGKPVKAVLDIVDTVYGIPFI